MWLQQSGTPPAAFEGRDAGGVTPRKLR